MGANDLTYSSSGLSLTEQFEGCELSAYQDQVGVWTIGYGHTGPDVTPGLSITLDQAQALLAQDVAGASACVNKVITVQLTQDEFDALVDFVFNLGAGAFTGSTLVRDLNAGDFTAAAAQFDLWDHAGGAVVAGLLRRRQAEAALFNTDGPSSTENA
ncbi:MAG TPA: lysozyme [Terracidiphilus sp.]|jgi:lysozyme